MRYLWGYEATQIPRISVGGVAGGMVENLLSQISLWNAVQLQVVSATKLTVEIRFEAMPGAGDSHGAPETRLFLLLGSSETGAHPEVARTVGAVERLLPPEYRWVRQQSAGASESQKIGGSWRVARVVRRAEFLSIPRELGLFRGGLLPEAENETQPGLARGVNELAGDERSEGPGSESWFLARHLPDAFMRDARAELASGRVFCVPVLGAFAEHIRNAKRMFQEIEFAAPVVVSIALHPVSESGLREDRQVALGWRRFVELFALGAANAGFADGASMRAVYDRYWLPDRYLAYASIRVAAQDGARAVGVAQHLAARLGGTRGFEVIPPEKEVLGAPSWLARPGLDIPQDTWSQKDWENSLQFWRERLAREAIAEPFDEVYLRFLARLPHMYTLEEIASLVSLPVADSAGLAGLDTAQVAPFHPPAQARTPVYAADGKAAVPTEGRRLRVGMVRRSPVVSEKLDWREPGTYFWHSIDADELTKHALIVGSTGSGKTVTTKFMLLELARAGVPFLVVEPVKAEYWNGLQAVRGLKRFCLDGDAGKRSRDYLAFDPMRLQKGVSVSRHASYLKSCFEAAFAMPPWLALILEGGIRDYYVDPREMGGCGMDLFSEGCSGFERVETDDGARRVFPSLGTFVEYFSGTDSAAEMGNGAGYLDRVFREDAASASQQAAEHKAMFRRRFQTLLGGAFGEACRLADDVTIASRGQTVEPFGSCLDSPTVLELEGVTDPEQKALVMAFLTTFLVERRQAAARDASADGASGRCSLKHVLVLEEAHRLLSASGGQRGGDYSGRDARATAVSLFVDMLAEMRALGQGVVVVEQIPTKLVSDAIKNTNLKIMLRLTSRDDREYLGEAMRFTTEQKEFVSTLRAKEGDRVQFVVFEETLDQPALLELPLGGDGSLHSEFFRP